MTRPDFYAGLFVLLFTLWGSLLPEIDHVERVKEALVIAVVLTLTAFGLSQYHIDLLNLWNAFWNP